MLQRWFRLALKGSAIGCSLPFLVVSLLIAGFGSAVAAALPRAFRREKVRCCEVERGWEACEFRFEHAIEAYEGLIDACARRAQ